MHRKKHSKYIKGLVLSMFSGIQWGSWNIIPVNKGSGSTKFDLLVKVASSRAVQRKSIFFLVLIKLWDTTLRICEYHVPGSYFT